MLDYGKPQTRAARLFGTAFIHAVKAFAYLGKVFFRNTYARIGNREYYLSAVGADIHIHLSSGHIVVHGVAAKIAHYLVYVAVVRAHVSAARNVYRNVPFFRLVRVFLPDFRRHRAQVDILFAALRPAAFQVAYVKHILHEKTQALALFIYAFKLLFLSFVARFGKQNFRQPLHGRERRFQLVRSVCEKFALLPYGGLFLGKVRHQHDVLYLPAFVVRLEAVHLEIQILSAQTVGKFAVLAAHKRVVHKRFKFLVLGEIGKMPAHYVVFHFENFTDGLVVKHYFVVR